MDQNHNTIVQEPPLPGFIYGLGATMQTLNDMAGEIARTDIPVLIVGESGTGKDAYAKLIHRLSFKGESRFKKINCASFEPADFYDLVHYTPGGARKIGEFLAHELGFIGLPLEQGNRNVE